MSSWTFETFKLGDIVTESRWNKGNTYQTTTIKVKGSTQVGLTLFDKTYPNQTQAHLAFLREKSKIKKGWYK